MKNKLILYTIVISLLGLTSCNRDHLYDDPSNPKVGSAYTMLTALQVNTFMNGEGELARYASMYSQHFAGIGGQYMEIQDYDLAESDFDNLWRGLYSGTMYNAKLLISEYGKDRPYYRGMAKILLAMNLGYTTDLWGDIPYSDAFQGKVTSDIKFFQPKFDSQEEILKTIQTLLDEAIAELSVPEKDNFELPSDDDLIFNGDAKSWIRAAWILKARYANRLSLKDGNGSAQLVENYVNNALAVKSVAKVNMEAIHSSTSPNQWRAFQGSRSGYLAANKYCVDLLQSSNDPRLPYYFNKVKDKNDSLVYIGADIQQQVISINASIMNISPTGFFNEKRNYPLITEYEAYFLLAEAQNRLGKNASEALNKAVGSSISYVTNGTVDGTEQAKFTDPSLTDILTQKWIAFCGQKEAYNDYRRTGIPALTPRNASFAVRAYTPERMPTAQCERIGNPNNAKVYELDVKVWWATK